MDLDGYYVSPVPLHFNKMKERGFDQSFLIAQQVARELHLPMANGLLQRIRDTKPQAKKSQVERGKNIKGAFAVNHPDWVKGKDILIVDDVITTGATANEAAKMLKKSGARVVHVFTLARA
jgi:ComF family protein